MRRSSLAISSASLLTLATACGGGTEPVPPRAGISVVAGGGVTDTIWAHLPTPLLVEVHDAGSRPQSGVKVRFEGTRPGSATAPPSAYPGAAPASPLNLMLEVTSDAAGRAQAYVLLGNRAGPAGIVVSVPSLGSVDTVRFTVRPGSPVRIALSPPDTAVYLGRTVQLRASLVDRESNPLDVPVTFASAGPEATVSKAGLVSGVAAGRARIAASGGVLTDTARVSVVPVVGAFAAHAMRRYGGDSIGVVVMNLDGSGYMRPITETPQPRDYCCEEPGGHEMPARWLGPATRLVYEQSMALRSGNYDGSDEHRLYTSAVAGGAPTPLLPASPFYTEIHPDVSADGAWVYFSARKPAELQLRIWRVHSNGTGLEQLTTSAEFVSDTRPSVSRDGARLVYSHGGTLRVRDLRTGVETSLGVSGAAPRWSPDGERLAYVNSYDYSGYAGALRVVQADGTGDRQVVTGVAYVPGLDWSPDGRYILAQGSFPESDMTELVDPETGARIPLPFGWRLTNPAWRPEP